MNNRLKVKSVGFYAQFVDKGRYMSMHRGYTASGSLDWCSYELGNAIVGNTNISSPLNNHGSPISIEISLGDFSLTFQRAAIVAITGASAQCSIDDDACDMYRALYVPAGTTLCVRNIGTCSNRQRQNGLRVYISVRGMIDAPTLFASSANVKRERSGGLHGDGQSLQIDDTIVIKDHLSVGRRSDCDSVTKNSIKPFSKQIMADIDSLRTLSINQSTPTEICFIPSYQWHHFSPIQHAKLFASTYAVTNNADRMGMRLAEIESARDDTEQSAKQVKTYSQDSKGLKCNLQNLYSQGLCNGAMQVAGDGQIIIMLNDRQTIGGYPVLGAVDAFSRARLAQLRPADHLVFTQVNQLNAAARIRIWSSRIENLSTRVDQLLGS